MHLFGALYLGANSVENFISPIRVVENFIFYNNFLTYHLTDKINDFRNIPKKRTVILMIFNFEKSCTFRRSQGTKSLILPIEVVGNFIFYNFSTVGWPLKSIAFKIFRKVPKASGLILPFISPAFEFCALAIVCLSYGWLITESVN